MTQWGRRSLSVCGNAERMKAFILFGDDNIHPLGGLLRTGFKHCWCIIADERAKCWLSYNWDMGLPVVRAEAPIEFDVAGFYRDEGWRVLDLADHNPSVVRTTFSLNNCVGNVKILLGIRSNSWTPYQLYRHMTRTPSCLTTALNSFPYPLLPGFGGGSASQQPVPVAVSAPQDASMIAGNVKASDEEKARRAQQKTDAAEADPDGVLLEDDGSTSNTTMLK
jgi:hypothetical protein